MPNTREKQMDRLTLPYQNGNGHYMKYCIQGGCSGICAYCEELDKMVERLAWYEDMVANGVTFANDNNIGDKLTPTADKLSATEWISVKDRLPEEHDSIFSYLYGTKSWQPGMHRKVTDEVIACAKRKDGRKRVVAIKMWDGEWDWHKLQDYEKVTHWMPLPQPPKGE